MRFSVLSLALAIFAPAFAFDEITVDQSTIAAGKSFDVTFKASSFDYGFDSTRIYLAITVPGWGQGPACYLVNSTTSKEKVTVSIPASVGESGDYYSISTMEFNTDPNLDGPSGFEYSDDFDLTGGTGEWTKYELSGHSVGDADSIPCTAYDCARKCSQKYYTSALDGDSDAAAEKIWDQVDDCIAKCPGVEISDDTDTGDDSDDSDDSGDDTSADVTTSVSTSATATGTSSTTITSAKASSTTTPTTKSANSTANGTVTSSTPTATGAASKQQISGLAALVTVMGGALLLLI